MEDWINVFTLHQNRVQHGATAKNCIQEKHIPNFLDLVVWGHEHECRADPEVRVHGLCSCLVAIEEDMYSVQSKI